MRGLLDRDKLEALMRALGAAVRGPGRVYFTGGASALLEGWRNSTVDADLKLDPEPPGAFEALRRLKDELDVNVELASPDDFLPPLPGWRERSRFVARHGPVDFLHYDFFAQALAKIERGYDRDLEDVRAMLRRDLIQPVPLRRYFAAIEPALVRYPQIDADVFRHKLEELLAEAPHGQD
ncbi:MAG: hypothetical protein KatS3mg102_2530 [Planctomycetota bacterium]|nr:MAG: hypothetical protein KatS3mg102_2530 [Planctomycetota bacterium]